MQTIYLMLSCNKFCFNSVHVIITTWCNHSITIAALCDS